MSDDTFHNEDLCVLLIETQEKVFVRRGWRFTISAERECARFLPSNREVVFE